MKYMFQIILKMLNYSVILLIVIGILLGQNSLWNWLFLIGEIVLIIMEQFLKSKNLLPTYMDPITPNPNEREIKQFIAILEETIVYAKEEKQKLAVDKASNWREEQFTAIALKELDVLLEYAQRGKVLFKYGSDNRKLDSIIFAKKYGINLCESSLGKQLIVLDKMYKSL